MKKLNISLEHCYGIKSLTTSFDFSSASAYAIYAPNGSMKSSLAKTFQDISLGRDSKDRIFPTRANIRTVTDEAGKPVLREEVLVVEPYDDEVGHSEKTSTLLVDAKLRREFDELQHHIDVAKALFISAVKQQAGTKTNMEHEFAVAFAADPKNFDVAMGRIAADLAKTAPHEHDLLRNVPYDLVFDEKVVAVLGTQESKAAIKQYIEKYNELLANSTYFKRGFNYYNAETIADQLAKNGFFEAKHSVKLNANESIEITTQKDLEAVIAEEKQQITNDAALRKKFAALGKQLEKNVTVRTFANFLSSNEWLLPRLENIESLRQDVLVAYARSHGNAYNDLIGRHQKAATRMAEIAKEAERQETLWERMIVQFNERFFVPFTLRATNKQDVVCGKDQMLSLEFTFEDGGESAPVERKDLLQVLSTGEKKAMYILNVLFEIEARKQAGQKTLLIVDDIADSFDYKNKYAIVQYLFEITRYANFRQIILTHNFDFFRTVHSRGLVSYENCYMASKDQTGLSLRKAEGFKNVFVNDWKKNFFKDEKKRIASIPFMRNLIEFTKGEGEPDFLKLTSLLHWRADTATITEGELDSIYDRLFGGNGKLKNGTAFVVDRIFTAAQSCLKAAQGANFENKIVLSIAIRLAAERYMEKEIADPKFVAGITDKQTSTLLERFSTRSPGKTAQIRTIQKVLLMTPENIHLNSFMYEPILDMSDDHLRALYSEICSLA